MARLRESVVNPSIEQRHPALMNAIYLWACFVSRPGALYQSEPIYLARALEALGDALQHNDKIVDIVRASCLLSMYFLSNGRMLEGSYHATAAASLALQFGLHGGTSQKSGWCFDQTDGVKVESGKEAIEGDERILAFWQAYNLDSCWSVVLRKPPAIRDARIAFNTISTPWPQNTEEYDAVSNIFILPNFS
jgi:Fungal specific transcription factor domain